MSMSATASLTPSTVSVGDLVAVDVTVDNPDLTDVDVVVLNPDASEMNQMVVGADVHGLLDGLAVTVPAGEQVAFHYTLRVLDNTASQLVRARVITADGQLAFADASLTVA